MRFAIVVALVCVAAVAFGDVKWLQTPDGLNSLHSQLSQPPGLNYFVQAADDFECLDGAPVVAVEWWGTYQFGTPPPPAGYYFVIEFWTDNGEPTPNSHPLDLIYTAECHTFTEDYDDNYAQWHFVAYLNIPFEQVLGNTYWISIYGVWDFLPSFHWCTGEPQWEDCANYRQGPPLYNNPPSGITEFWQSTADIEFWGYYCYDMAFVLHGEQEPEDPLEGLDVKWPQLPDGLNSLHSQLDEVSSAGGPITFFVQAADDFFCDDGREIVAVEWWGTFPIGGYPPAPGYYFQIEFWTDNPGPPSHPETMIYQEPIFVFIEEYDDVFSQYRFAAELPAGFPQQQGNTYWISIYGVWDFEPSFNWCTGGPPWNDCATYRDETGLYAGGGTTPQWQSTADILMWSECYDMAFVLYVTDAGSTVEETSWGNIKAMFR